MRKTYPRKSDSQWHEISCRISVVSVALSLILSLTVAPRTHADEEWPIWRGPNRDAHSASKGLLDTWDGAPPLAWKADNLGKGFSSITMAKGRVYTMGDRDGTCQIIALDDSDGHELWAADVGKPWEPNGSYPGPRCSPTYSEGRVYAIGSRGDLVCVSAKTGKELWRKNFAKDFGGKMMSGWGFSESPLIDGNKLVCTPGGKNAMMVALNKKTGKEIWRSPSPQGNHGRSGAGYSSIVISHAAKTKQYVQLTGRGVIGVDAKTGRLLWTYGRIANTTANIPTPIVRDDYVFCSTGYGTGAALLKIIRSGSARAPSFKADEVYFLNGSTLQNHHGGMILVGDYLYCGRGNNNGLPTCIEFKTGKMMWPKKTRGPGRKSAALGYADGHLYFRYQNAVMALVPANPEKFEVVGKFNIPDSGFPSWPHPIILNGRLYLRDQGQLYCYDIKK